MFQYRLTKYDPTYRNHDGSYTKESWTSVSDIGTEFEGETLNKEKYLQIETEYVDKLVEIFKEVGLTEFQISEFSDYRDELSIILDHELQELIIEEKESFSIATLPLIIRLTLRDQIWCKIISPKAFIHFGYDLYCYVGVQTEIKNFTSPFLFLEPMNSPYS